jgi:hypothetical protein
MELQELQKAFFQDPRWKGVERIILDYINPLLDMKTIDTTQPAEAVKAEVIGRIMAYDKLFDFISQTGMIGQSRPKDVKSPFR